MRAILLTGEYGAGKSSVAVEMTHQLGEGGVRSAAIDLDWLAWVGPDLDTDEYRRLLSLNLAAVMDSYMRYEVERVVLAHAVRCAADHNLVRDALGGVDLQVAMLRLDHHDALQRIRSRDRGREREELLQDADATAAAVTSAGVEDFVIDNEPDCRLEDVARETLVRAGWIPSTH